jgi:hypothetical protein
MDDHKTRKLIAGVQSEIARLGEAVRGGAGASEANDVRSAFRALVDHLAIGPEPETRACAACGRSIMRDATRCKYCWATSAA